MVEFTCNLCLKIFKKKYNYNRHLNRKYPCKNVKLINRGVIINPLKTNFYNSKTTIISTEVAPISTENIKNYKKKTKEHICSFCSLSFTRISSLNRHLKYRCKILYNDYNYNDLIKRIEKLENTKHNHSNININNNIINNNHINIVAFGKEDLTKISDDIYKLIMDKGFQSIPQLIKYLHFNEKNPEYHNIFISNIRDNKVKVYNGEKCILLEDTEIFNKLYNEKSDYLEIKYDEISDKLKSSTKKKFERFLNNKDDEKHMDKIYKNIKLLLYNHRDVPLKTLNSNKIIK
jgi:hypothetical protein